MGIIVMVDINFIFKVVVITPCFTYVIYIKLTVCALLCTVDRVIHSTVRPD